MSYQLLDSRTAAAAKEHPCIWCRDKINKGEKYLYVAGVFYGEFQANHWHPECKAASDQYFQEDGEEDFDPHTHTHTHTHNRGTNEEWSSCNREAKVLTQTPKP